MGIYITSVIDIEQFLNAAAMEARMSILFYDKSAKKTTDNLVPIYLLAFVSEHFPNKPSQFISVLKMVITARNAAKTRD